MNNNHHADEQKVSEHSRASNAGTSVVVQRQPHPTAIIQRSMREPGSLTPGDVLHLQRTIGNHAVRQLLTQTEHHPGEQQQQPIQRTPIEAITQRKTNPTPVVQQQESEPQSSPIRTVADNSVQRSPKRGFQRRDTPPPSISTSPKGEGAVQRVEVPLPSGVRLTGGAGVSVLWKKSKSSDVPHVTVAHGAVNQKKGTVPVTNFHYKFDRTGYFHWDDKGKGTTFKFRGGSPTKGVYTQTSKQAKKFGITLDEPSNLATSTTAPSTTSTTASTTSSTSAPTSAPKPVSSSTRVSDDSWGDETTVTTPAAPVTTTTTAPTQSSDEVVDDWEKYA